MGGPLQTIFTELALYNQWQNQVVYEICQTLGEEELSVRRPGLFFETLHRTLDHILHVDVVLLQFIRTEKPPKDFRPGEVQFPTFVELARRRPLLDAEILELITGSSEEWLSAPIAFDSERLARRRCFPRSFLLSQMFNHQTHHRSQATATLHALGYEYGATDLPMNPLSQF